MNLLVHPLAQLALIAAGLLGMLLLCVSLKRENAALRRRVETEQDALSDTVEAVKLQVRQLQTRLEEGAGHAPEPIACAPGGGTMNLNKRSEALRLSRRGETSERIASALQLPRNEVELLLKVHRTVIDVA